MKYYKIKSFAKINLYLGIISKMRNKMHKIESIVFFCDLYDLIKIRVSNNNNHLIKFDGKFSKGLNKKNNIKQLLDLLDLRNLLKDKKFDIKITKNIPQQSGMGGGSMNVANILIFLIKKKFLKLSHKELNKTRYRIGSDVVLGLNKKQKLLRNFDDIMNIKKKLAYYLLILKPNFGCDSAEIYKNIKNYSKPKFKKRSIVISSNTKNYSNDLESVAIKKYPILKKIKKNLLKLPNILDVKMTGSGSAFVGYFNTKKDLRHGTKIIRKLYKNYWSIESKSI